VNIFRQEIGWCSRASLKRESGVRLVDSAVGTSAAKTARARSGFTLVEVLLAVTILTLLITSIYATWSTTLMAWRRGRDASEVFQRQRVVIDTLSELAQSVVYFAASPDLYAVTGTSRPDWGDSVSFVTASDVALPPSEAIDAGMRRVTISMEQDEYGRKYLALVNAPAVSVDQSNTTTTADVTLQAHVLSMDVSGFYVRYLDPRDGTWYDKWEENTIIPSAMQFTVVFTQQDAKAPPVVVTRAVDLPVAAFIAANAGIAGGGQANTNGVSGPPIDPSNPQYNPPPSSVPPGPAPGRT
jgi:prepilin-type N-terminal cleavage/methylation domain-containing protein